MQRPHRSAHALLWRILAVVLPLTVIGGLALRSHGPLERPAVRLEAP